MFLADPGEVVPGAVSSGAASTESNKEIFQ